MDEPAPPTAAPRPDRRRWVLGGLAALVVVGGIFFATWPRGGDDDPTPSKGRDDGGRTVLEGFSQIGVTVTSSTGQTAQRCMLLASSEEQRERGLMEVTDRSLGGHDGMLFVFPQDSTVGFWMYDTPMPLSIAYLDRRGRIVSTFDMASCGPLPDGGPNDPAVQRYRADCIDASSGYTPAGPYRYVVEVPKGRLDDVGLTKGSVLRLATTCPALR